GRPDVSVAEHGHAGDGLLQRRDRVPVSGAGVELARRARMQGDRGRAGILGDASGVEVGEMVGVDALAHLDGEGDPPGRSHGPGDDLTEQPQLPGQRRSPALARHLRHGAAEVEIDVIGAILRDEDPHRLGHRLRVDAVQLDRAWRLGFMVADEAHGGGVALHEGARGDHLADVEAGAVLAAESPERGVGDARHRRQHHRRPQLDRADAQRLHGQVGGEGDGHRSILPESGGCAVRSTYAGDMTSVTAADLREIPFRTPDGDTRTIADYGREVVLVVNVASRCGLTPQYEQLEKLQETYGERGFTVLGFPCNQFMGQEPGSMDAILEYCATTWGVSFPILDKVKVNGGKAAPLFEALRQTPDAHGKAGRITWNFEKFLLTPDGVVHRFRPKVTPDDPAIVRAIEQALPR